MQFRRTPFYLERCLACEAERGRHPWSVASLARPRGVATRGALPRLRGREGSPPVERCLACEADRSEPGSPDLTIMPPKIVERTLERPVIGIRNQTVTDWVVPNVEPFNVVAVAVS
jgi:hypothetical protein